MSKGTILYVGGFELPDKNAAAHRVISNGKILRDLGYNVVFVGNDKEQDYLKDVLETKKIIQGFECWSKPYPITNVQWIDYLSNISFNNSIINQYKNVEIIIAYNYPSVALMRLKKYCRIKGILLIADCTEWYSVKGNNIIFKIIKGTDSFLRMRIVQKKIDGIIVVSSYLEHYYRKNKHVLRVPPLVDLSEEKWKVSFLELDKFTINLVYAGSPGKNKDKLEILIKYLCEITESLNFTLNIIGITKEKYIDNFCEIKKLIDKLGSKIIFHGRLSHEDSLLYVMKADFSVVFRDKSRTIKAGFPTKFVESISCGTPVITSRNSDLESYVNEGENGYFFDINDNENILSVLKKALDMRKEDVKIMKKMSRNSEIFSYKKYSCKFEKFLNEIEGSLKL